MYLDEDRRAYRRAIADDRQLAGALEDHDRYNTYLRATQEFFVPQGLVTNLMRRRPA
jgi:hypothetical protein